MEQMVNQAAKWYYMFDGKASIPIVIRMVIGRGWGQGPQHSQSPQSLFAHVNGLKVVMPSTPGDAKSLLLASIADDNPVIFLEHRWLHNIKGPVEETPKVEKLGKARVIREGSDISIIASSHMVIESLRAAEILAGDAISAEVIDLRTISPLDSETILTSVRKTGRIVVVDGAPKSFGIGAECIARVSEEAFSDLKAKPQRIALPDHPIPASPALANLVYPGPAEIATTAAAICEKAKQYTNPPTDIPADVPDNSFSGPF
jgi:pyruvate dehydrogenase E1 component beta subunit